MISSKLLRHSNLSLNRKISKMHRLPKTSPRKLSKVKRLRVIRAKRCKRSSSCNRVDTSKLSNRKTKNSTVPTRNFSRLNSCSRSFNRMLVPRRLCKLRRNPPPSNKIRTRMKTVIRRKIRVKVPEGSSRRQMLQR